MNSEAGNATVLRRHPTGSLEDVRKSRSSRSIKGGDTPLAVFAHLVARTSDRRLERLMRGPLRRPLLCGIVRALPGRIDRDRAGQARSEFELAVGGRSDGGDDRFRVVVDDGECRVVPTAAGTAPVSIEIGPAAFLRLVAGVSNPMQLYMSGELRLQGDLTGALRLQTLFRPPASGRRA